MIVKIQRAYLRQKSKMYKFQTLQEFVAAFEKINKYNGSFWLIRGSDATITACRVSVYRFHRGRHNYKPDAFLASVNITSNSLATIRDLFPDNVDRAILFCGIEDAEYIQQYHGEITIL